MGKLVVYLDDTLHNAFKKWCKKNNISMSEAVTRFISFAIKNTEIEEEMRKAKLRSVIGLDEATFEKLKEHTLVEIRNILKRNEAFF